MRDCFDSGVTSVPPATEEETRFSDRQHLWPTITSVRQPHGAASKTIQIIIHLRYEHPPMSIITSRSDETGWKPAFERTTSDVGHPQRAVSFAYSTKAASFFMRGVSCGVSKTLKNELLCNCNFSIPIFILQHAFPDFMTDLHQPHLRLRRREVFRFAFRRAYAFTNQNCIIFVIKRYS